LIPYLQRNGVYVYLTGATKERMANTFSKKLNYVECNSMEDAVKTAFYEAQKNDIILLSPACASFDAFNNYRHRGDSFKGIVRELSHE